LSDEQAASLKPGAHADAGITRNVKILGAVSLAQATGSEMLYPLLPTLLTGVLGAPVVALRRVPLTISGIAALGTATWLTLIPRPAGIPGPARRRT
jgi:hypothetical protein